MDYAPEDIYGTIKKYRKYRSPLPLLLRKLYSYQICRGLLYLHALGITHRDIKPQNVLVFEDNRVALCDFGSAKKIVKGTQSIAYICSRFYRAPELILGATEYTGMIDVWSLGCIITEIILTVPLFPGKDRTDQFVQIIKIMGTPSKEEILAMNPKSKTFEFPRVEKKPLKEVFRSRADDVALDLLTKILVYTPSKRLKLTHILLHPWFDQLRCKDTTHPNGTPLPDLFNFTKGNFVE
jgi:glycogen synthase kinase 3 beta